VTVSDERLARVTYLPGVVPPEPVAASPSTGSEADGRSVAEPVEAQLAEAIARIESRAAASVAEPVEAQLIEAQPVEAPETQGERSARAHNVSMHALTRRGLSSAEMTDLLRSRELDQTDIEVEVTRLEQVGLLDDRELASNLVRTLRERKGLGRSAISAELRRRRIDSAAIEEAMGAVEDDELNRAREVALKRAPQLRSLDAETAHRRLGAFLMRKGYSGSVVASAVAAALAPGGSSGRGPRFE
jgi:regulatory protein